MEECNVSELVIVSCLSFISSVALTGLLLWAGTFTEHIKKDYNNRQERVRVSIGSIIYCFIVNGILALIFWALMFAWPIIMLSIIAFLITVIVLICLGIVYLAPETDEAKNIVKMFTVENKELTEDKE